MEINNRKIGLAAVIVLLSALSFFPVLAESASYGPFSIESDFDTIKVGDKFYIDYTLPSFDDLQDEYRHEESIGSEIVAYKEIEVEQNITGGFQDVFNMTFNSSGTPGVEYLVFGRAEATTDSSADYLRSRILVDGVEEGRVTWTPKNEIEDYQSLGQHSVEFYDEGPHTIRVQLAAESSATASIKRIRFVVFQVVYSKTSVAGDSRQVSTSDYQQISSLTFTPEFPGPYFMLVDGEHTSGSTSRSAAQLTKLDGAIVSETRFEPVEATDWKPFFTHFVEDLSDTTHSVTIEGSCSTGDCKYRNMHLSAIRLTEKFKIYTSQDGQTQSTTLETWQNATTLDITKEPGQSYLFGATSTHWIDTTNAQSAVRLQLNGNQTLCEHIQEPKEVGTAVYDIFPFICMKAMLNDPLPVGNHTVALQHRVNPGSGGTPTQSVRYSRAFAIRQEATDAYEIDHTDILALKAQDEFLHIAEVEVCAELRADEGDPNVVLAIDDAVFENITFDINGSLETSCVTLNRNNDTEGWLHHVVNEVPELHDHYFGVSCLNCSQATNTTASIGLSGFVETNSYHSSDGGATYELEPREYVIDANVRMLEKDATMNLTAVELVENVSKQVLVSKNNTVNNSREIGFVTYNATYPGGKQFAIENGNFSFVDVRTYAWLPDAQELLSSLNLQPQGAYEAYLNETVVHEWTYQQLEGLNFTLNSCEVYEVTDTNSLMQVNVTPYNMTVQDKIVSVKWMANSSSGVQETHNYATQCSFNVTLGIGEKKQTYSYDNLRQFVYINQERTIWNRIVEIWNLLLGIEQTVNETNVLAEEINVTTNDLRMNLQVPNGFGYAGDQAYVIAKVFDGQQYVDGANCTLEMLRPDGTVLDSGNFTNIGNGTYRRQVSLPADTGAYSTAAICSYSGNTVSQSGTFEVANPVRMTSIT